MRACVCAIGAVFSILVATGVLAAESAGSADSAKSDPLAPWLDNEIYKVNIELRPRIELADQDGLDDAQAYTLRSRVGLLLKPYYGFSAKGELLNVWSADDDAYFDGASQPNGETKIADPEQTELNQLWAQFHKPEWWGVKAKGGRQLILLDDHRFVGNVGWRQGEQKYDAALGETTLGVDDLTLQYAYIWDVRRFFGDQGPAAQGARDWDSDSHIARVNYRGLDFMEVSAFAYFLDFESDSPGNSSNTYGFRAAGGTDIGDDWVLKYAGSYAFQTDAEANPADYDAHYVWLSVDTGPKDLGTFGVGYELLGSDDGDARFVTPLATAHKFNGFADVFLDNGGTDGLQDLSFKLAPKLPWKLKGHLAYHEFWSHEDEDHLGREIDGVLSRPINDYITALTKFAYFAADTRSRDDIYRIWFQLTLSY